MLSHFIAFLTTFTSVFLKGFQHKNVIGGHLKSIAITSYFMAVTDVILVGLISQKGFVIAFSCGTGAALGMIISVHYHVKIMDFMVCHVQRFKSYFKHVPE